MIDARETTLYLERRVFRLLAFALRLFHVIVQHVDALVLFVQLNFVCPNG